MFMIGYLDNGTWPTSMHARAFLADGTAVTGVLDIERGRGQRVRPQHGQRSGRGALAVLADDGRLGRIGDGHGNPVWPADPDPHDNRRCRANTLTGDDLTDVMRGNGGADRIIGEGGDDVVRGDGGDDTLYGNGGADLLIGDSGNDTLNGGRGSDSMQGGSGNDIYFVNGSGDLISESAGNGSADRVAASASYGLTGGLSIEILSTTAASGTDAINLSGNGLSQSIIGNAGANRLNGGRGNDVLTGHGGADVFRFTTDLVPTNIDEITDYNVAQDRIDLDNAIFAGLAPGVLATGRFVANASGQATTLLHRIIYETDTGNLYYDADGNGGTARVRFGILDPGLMMSSSEFLIV